MAMLNEFTCPKNHKFSANAKLRARCPECGQMARRQFTPQTSTRTTELPTPSTSTPSSHKVVTRKTTTSGLKSDSTSTKEKPLESETKLSVEPVKSTISKKPVVVKQGLNRTMPKTVKKSVTPVPQPKTRGPVKRVTARRGISPVVLKSPKGSKERKVLEQTTEIPFWQKVKRQFFV